MGIKKTVFKSILFTVLVGIVLFACFTILMFFAFTKNLANFMYNIGADRMASTLYHRVYEKTDEIFYCYKALNIKISLNDSARVIQYYEEFLEDDEYQEFMISNKTNREKLDISVLEKSALLNDRNFLVNNYVKALLNENELDKAWTIVLSEFKTHDVTLKEQGVYAMGNFIDREEWNKFKVSYDGYSNILIVELQNYFDKLNTLFDQNRVASTHVDKAYVVALGNRIINVGQDINSYYLHEDNDNEIISSNINFMVEVNNTLKGLV